MKNQILFLTINFVFVATGMGSIGIMEGDMLNLRLNEKELLNGLNSRMAAYIEKGLWFTCELIKK